jgi:hypothetical protein
MARNEIHAQDAVDQPTGEAFGNITGSTVGTKRALDVASLGADGVTDVNGNAIAWDAIAYAEPTTASETYTYSLGGTDLVVYTITYTDATKATLASNAIAKSAP